MTPKNGGLRLRLDLDPEQVVASGVLMYGTTTMTDDLKKDLKRCRNTEQSHNDSHGQIFAVWILAAKLQNSDLSVLLGSPCRGRG